MKMINGKEFFLEENTVVTIGNFDGLHLGHQKLIEEIKKIKNDKGFKSVVFSFYPHPIQLIKKSEIRTILSQDEKKKELEKFDIDFFINYTFDNKTMNLLPEDFVKNVLINQLKCKVLVIGEEFKFGKNNMGSIDELNLLSQKYDFNIITIKHENINNIKISSRLIREDIKNAEFNSIKNKLGKEYFIEGKVVSGKKLGRTINFPTANLLPHKEKILPQNGVYITKTEIAGKEYRSITNIGVNPTIDNNNNKIVETYIFDFNQDIYDKTIKVKFYEFIRAEVKFKNIDELKDRMREDYEIASQFFLNKK